MEKTAMQELIDFIENQEYNFLNDELLEKCTKFQDKAKELLVKEKQQIIDAYKTFLDTTLPNEVYEEYYNDKFKSE